MGRAVSAAAPGSAGNDNLGIIVPRTSAAMPRRSSREIGNGGVHIIRMVRIGEGISMPSTRYRLCSRLMNS
jgi:hypothetical protein